jgi:hypothetical protein
MTCLCHECGLPLDDEGYCPQGCDQAQPCPDPAGICAACEAIRRGWSPERLAHDERNQCGMVWEITKQVTDGMVRHTHNT